MSDPASIPLRHAYALYRTGKPEEALGTCLAGLSSHANDPEPCSLAADILIAWHAFEQSHPDTFINMYQFWTQKP